MRRELAEKQVRLEREALQHQAAGELAAAVTSAQQMLAAETEVLGDDHSDVDSSLRFLAVLSALAGNPAEARAYAERSLATHTRLTGAESWPAGTSQQLLKLVDRIAELNEAERNELNGAMVDFRAAIEPPRDAKPAVAL